MSTDGMEFDDLEDTRPPIRIPRAEFEAMFATPGFVDGIFEAASKEAIIKDAIPRMSLEQLNTLFTSPELIDSISALPRQVTLIPHQPNPDERWPGTLRPPWEKDIGTVAEVKAREELRLKNLEPPQQES